MCKAMNAPLLRVLGFRPPPPERKGEEAKELPWTPVTTPEVREILMAAESVIIAPGYGGWQWGRRRARSRSSPGPSGR